jgi:L-asparaginase II
VPFVLFVPFCGKIHPHMPTAQQADQENRTIPLAEPLVEVKRGSITESRHRGHIVVVAPDGNIIGSAGAFETVTFLRSSAKPFQAMPLLVSGAADRFGFTDREVALACASHNGEPIHTELVTSMLHKIGLGPEALRCGVHEPYGAEAARELQQRGEQPNALHNNCSGKHAGMLAVALHLGAAIDNYESPENPVQKAIAETISQFSGVPLIDLAVGVDGCAAPIFGITVKAMALAYARLVSPPANFDKKTQDACERIVRVMSTYPELIGGTSDRLDTEVMRAAPRRLISKVGAEGVYTAGINPCKEWPNGLGLALKIEDGDDKRARPTVVIETLRQLGVLRDESLEAVGKYSFFPVYNSRGDLVGEITASFALKGPSGEVIAV